MRASWLLSAALLMAACSSRAPEPAVPAQQATGAAEAAKEPKKLAPFAIYAMGDNRGEIEPCGCRTNPRGGLSRRAHLIGEAREAGPTLLLDAGDALFEHPFRRGERDEEKATLLLESMAGMGTAAMAVGDRDLTFGYPWLVKHAAEAGLPLLSANLRAESGERPFESRRLFTVGEAKVGVFGIFGQQEGMKLPEGLQQDEPAVVAIAEVEALRKEGADLVVALVHGPTAIVRAIAEIPGVDMIVPSHDGSLSHPYQPRPGGSWIFGGGQLGRTLTRIELRLEGEGALVDAGAAAKLAVEQRELQGRLEEARSRFAVVPAGGLEREAFTEMIARLETRLAQVQGRVATAGTSEGPRFAAEFIDLVLELPEDPTVAGKVASFQQAPPKP